MLEVARFTATAERDLFALPQEQVQDALRTQGAVLFSGFALDTDSFRRFVASYSRDVVVHPNWTREPVTEDKTVVLVDANEDPIPAHAELTYLPLRPELQWFWCLQPAESGGETTLYDGVATWQSMSSDSQRQLLEKRWRWSLPRALWRPSWCTMFGVANAEAARTKFDRWPGFRYEFDVMQRLAFDYTVSAVTQTRYSNERAFANNYLAGGPQVCFEDGSPLPDGLHGELTTITESMVVVVALQAGDLLMIDNSRVMHGRRGFADRRRKIAAMISNAGFD